MALTYHERCEERLKDRRDYRNALIQRREDIERKIERTEKQIKNLKEQGKAQ